MEGFDVNPKQPHTLTIEIRGANVEAATYIMAAVFNNIDHGDIEDVQLSNIKKSENSFDWFLILHYGEAIWNIVSPFIVYLLGRRDLHIFENEVSYILENPDLKRKAEPALRAMDYAFKEERTRVTELIIWGRTISRKTVKEETYREFRKIYRKDDDKKSKNKRGE